MSQWWGETLPEAQASDGYKGKAGCSVEHFPGTLGRAGKSWAMGTSSPEKLGQRPKEVVLHNSPRAVAI